MVEWPQLHQKIINQWLIIQLVHIDQPVLSVVFSLPLYQQQQPQCDLEILEMQTREPTRSTESETLGIYGRGHVIVKDLGQVTWPLYSSFPNLVKELPAS